MRIFKLIIGSFIVLLAIITIISLFIPPDVQISKAVEINAPKDSVMDEVSDPLHWKDWYPVNESMKLLYIGEKASGALLDDQTSLQILAINPEEVKAKYSMALAKEIMTAWKIIQAENSVAVQWSMDFHLHWYPWEKFSGLLLEKR